VTFSLINIKEFTARVDSGKIKIELLNLLQKIPGAKFDWDKRRWVFPITSHDSLQVALARRRCQVETIPREVLVATQLSTRNSSSSASANDNANDVIEIDLEEENVSKADKLLKSLIPEEVLRSLAKFQQEAVLFVYDKQGRALVADEMGLGKTRTAIGSNTLL
jgi:hypothetical protein